MAFINFQPKDFFNTLLYTDNASNRTLTGVGFQPDFVWIKTRNHGNAHNLFDSVRGANKNIRSSSTAAEVTTTDTLTAFTSDGFSLGADASGYGVNYDNKNEVAWNWKAGTTSGITTNSDTSITPSAYSFNQTSGFSMVKYTGTAVDGAYLPHGLGKAPELLFLKQTSGTEPWQVYSKPTGYGGRGWLNTADAFQTSRGEWYSTNPDSVNMRISNDSHINGSGETYIAYFFTSIKGYCNIGSYIGNGNADGAFIYTGFKPAFVITKKTSDSDNWILLDNKRDTAPNPHKLALFANTTGTEAGDYLTDFCSNGFKIRSSTGSLNTSGGTYIYMAFAEVPLVASNGDPATGF